MHLGTFNHQLLHRFQLHTLNVRTSTYGIPLPVRTIEHPIFKRASTRMHMPTYVYTKYYVAPRLNTRTILGIGSMNTTVRSSLAVVTFMPDCQQSENKRRLNWKAYAYKRGMIVIRVNLIKTN